MSADPVKVLIVDDEPPIRGDSQGRDNVSLEQLTRGFEGYRHASTIAGLRSACAFEVP
jgi:hypothetical protein